MARVSDLFRACCQGGPLVPVLHRVRLSLAMRLSGKVAVFVLRVGSIFVGYFASECGGVSWVVGL